EFVYDGKFRRRIRREFTWSSGAWSQTNEVRYVYDGNNVIQERDGNNARTVTYTRGGATLLARTDSTVNAQLSTTFYHADGNRDPLSESAGANLYGYCGNDPVDFYDPTGLWSIGSLSLTPLANWLDKWINRAENNLTTESTLWNWGLYNDATFAHGFADLLRF